MRLRDPRNASLLILATDTVVIGLIVVVVASLGVGFLVGYKVSDWSKEGISLFSGVQSKAPSPGSARVGGNEQKPQDAIPAMPRQEAVKDAAKAAPESPPKEQQPPPEEKPLKASSSAEQLSPKEAPQSAETKTGDVVKPARETKQKQGRAGATVDGKPRKAAGEASSGKKVADDSGPTDSASGSPAAPAKAFTIQVGALPQRQEAEQLQERLVAKGFKAYIVNEGEQDPYFRVRVGKFRDRKSAEQAAVSLREKIGAESYILVTKP